MRLYNNPWMAIAYLLGKGTQDAKNKIQNTINERDKKKELESAISYFSIDEEKRKRRNKISKKLEKCAQISFIICVLGILCLFICMFFSATTNIPNNSHNTHSFVHHLWPMVFFLWKIPIKILQIGKHIC